MTALVGIIECLVGKGYFIHKKRPFSMNGRYILRAETLNSFIHSSSNK